MRMRAYVLPLVLSPIVFLMADAVGAQPSSAPPPFTPPSFTITGKVVDAQGGQSLARSVVAISPTTQRSASLSVTTGEDGGFAFAGLAVGKYRLTASHRGYRTQSFQEHGDLSTAIAVGPGLRSDDLRFRLTPQSILYGMISDEAGDPIRGAQVKLYADREQVGVRSTLARETATTDDQGKYEIAEAPPGDYYLSVSAQPWYAHDGGLAHLVQPSEENADEAPDSALNVAYPTTFYPNVTSSDEATPIPLRGGEHLEVNLTLNPQHAVRVRIPLPQRDGASFNVALTQSVFGQPEPVTSGAQTDQGGVFEVDGLLPGQYDFTVNQFGENPGSKHFTAEVGAGPTTLVDAETVDDVTVTGRVSGFEAIAPHAEITLFCPHPPRNYSAPLDDAGEFSIKVPPGDYEVIGHIPQMFLARVASANATVHGRMVAVKGGVSPRLEIDADKGFAHIDGFVTSGRKRPGGVLVLLAPEDAGNNQILFRRDQSDSDGSFSLYQVVPGRYRLMAIDQGWDLEWSDPSVLRAFAKKSIPIQVHPGEKITQWVEMQAK